MITYFLKSATCLALLLAFYHFVLEKEKMHTFNRFYLLGSVLFSFLAPLYIIYIDVAPMALEASQPVSAITFSNFKPTEVSIDKSINYTQIFVGIYLIISSILLLRFSRNLFKIIHKIRKNTKVTYQKAKLVLVSDKILPHTFWNFIFINKDDYENEKIEQELFTHELTHVTQRHTLDVLILELAQVIFWINPFFILLKKAVQLNHEFLADERVIKQHKNTFQYQHLLLNTAAWKNEYYLASNLNYSLTKKRLLMMTTQSSQTKILLKKLAVIPLLTGSIFLFAERVEAQKITEVQEIIETPLVEVPYIQHDLSDSEIYKEYYYQTLIFRRNDKNGNMVSKKYNELNDKEKARLAPPLSLKFKKIVPTKQQIEDLKDNSKYAIWIDGKVAKNEVLNNYKNTDFSRYSNSHVYKNARSKRFPQENQAHLETTKYFENQNEKRVKDFEEYLKKQEKQVVIETIYEQDQIRDNEVRAIIDEIGEKYKKETNPKFNKNWFITIDGQKYYYTFDKEERIARYYLNGKLINLDIVKEYKKKHKVFKKLKATGKHYVFKPENEQKEIDREFSDLGGMYFRMPRADKNKVPYPENPIKPYVRLRKGDKIWYKKRDELTEEEKLLLPLPPPPISPLDHVIKMAKKDATFYYEGTKITSDKALELLKNNKNLNIDTRNIDSEKPIVKISKEPITIKKK
jgi:bla regulator protein BlaR1